MRDGRSCNTLREGERQRERERGGGGVEGVLVGSEVVCKDDGRVEMAHAGRDPQILPSLPAFLPAGPRVKSEPLHDKVDSDQ